MSVGVIWLWHWVGLGPLGFLVGSKTWTHPVIVVTHHSSQVLCHLVSKGWEAHQRIRVTVFISKSFLRHKSLTLDITLLSFYDLVAGVYPSASRLRELPKKTKKNIIHLPRACVCILGIKPSRTKFWYQLHLLKGRAPNPTKPAGFVFFFPPRISCSSCHNDTGAPKWSHRHVRSSPGNGSPWATKITILLSIILVF